jgi:hypothetical protein
MGHEFVHSVPIQWQLGQMMGQPNSLTNTNSSRLCSVMSHIPNSWSTAVSPYALKRMHWTIHHHHHHQYVTTSINMIPGGYDQEYILTNEFVRSARPRIMLHLSKDNEVVIKVVLTSQPSDPLSTSIGRHMNIAMVRA